MGWYFSSPSRSVLIRELVQPSESARVSVRTLAHTLCDDVLWSVIELTAKEDGVRLCLQRGQSMCFIRCDLIACDGGTWGHKPLDEAMHPFYYSCPLSYLDMAPEQSAQWRAGVRSYHAMHTPAAATASTAKAD